MEQVKKNEQAMKVVLTGATGGIGSEISRRLVQKGCVVFGLGRNNETLQSMLQEFGDHFHPIVCDVLNRESVQQSCELILQKTGEIDCLINNAGLLRLGETHRISETDMDLQFDTMVKATFLFTIAFLPSMLDRGKGLIINMASVAGEKASPKMAVYGASKAAIIHFTKSLALEYADKGIRAISICPGTVQTGLMDKFLLALIQKKVPLKRLAEAGEIAELVEYLILDGSPYMTGTNIIIDGGVSL